MEKIKDSKYFVDVKGNVYSPDGRKLKPCPQKKGYLAVGIVVNGERKTKKIHRLVAETFIPNPENKPQVNHIDGDKTNNHVSNLEWVTPRENSIHAVYVLGKGTCSTHSKVIHSEETIRKICEMLQDNYRNVDIAKRLSVPRELVTRIRMRKVWKQVADEYEFSPSRTANVSDETVLWVAHRLEEGWSTKEIIQKCNHRLTKHTVSKIRRRSIRPHLLENFNF